MTAVVIGESGQLARHLQRSIPDACFWGRKTVDATDARSLETALLEAMPSCIINAAAYTAVDHAEQEPDLAWRLNVEVPAAAARAATVLDIPLVHISTDYVFDGRRSTPYAEHDAVYPLNAYGRTKLAGELAVRTHCSKHWILRTSWLFSEYGQNFVTNMIRLAKTQRALAVVADQRGRPTYAGDLAKLIEALVTNSASNVPLFGIYHATDGPVMSWHGFAELIFEEALSAGMLEEIPEVQPIPTSAYPTAAARPRNAVLAPSAVMIDFLPGGFDYVNGLRSTLTVLAGR
jgi:dTDP-4-dehydrorhamnose reductase